MAKLSAYIVHRKTILEILEKSLDISDKITKEKVFHSLVFPMNCTSNDVAQENQNLWLIDERLTFHDYLASDKHFNKIEKINSVSTNKPDIIIWNNPIIFADGEKPNYQTIDIIEFKRPGDTLSENPIEQIYRYIEEIKNGEQLDKKGQRIILRNNTPFYAYIICDLSDAIKKIAAQADLTKSPDDLGYFGYNKNYGVYVEIISYTKLLSDSKKRNQILFDKLSII
jgi:hypothetical protein